MSEEFSFGNDRVISLQSREGDSFDLPAAAAAAVSQLVKDAMDDPADDEEIIPCPLPRVSTDCLRRIVDFMNHHHKEPMDPIPTPLNGNTFEEVMTQTWFQEFVSNDNTPQDMLFELLTAANYMGIKPLLDLACLKVTFQLNGKNAEEIRQILNLPELSPEEETRARGEHPWIFEETYP